MTPNEQKASIEVHHTCRHSDKYDYSCGECIEKIIKEARADERRRIGEIVRGIKKEVLVHETIISCRKVLDDLLSLINKE